MVLCLMVNCHVRSGRDKEISFFRVPSVIKNQGKDEEELSKERRQKWLAAISRKGLTEEILQNDRVCSRHFVSGRPSKDKFNIDWVPSLHLGHDKKVNKLSEVQAARSERAISRQKRKQAMVGATSKVQLLDVDGVMVKELTFDKSSESVNALDTDNLAGDLNDLTAKLEEINIKDATTQTESACKRHLIDSGTQTEEYQYMFKKTEEIPLDTEALRNDDEKVRFYTGLSSFHILNTVFEHVSPLVTRKSVILTKFQELMVVLVKLRLDVPMQDLAYRFGVHKSTISRIFSTWIKVMDVRLSPLIHWPEREALWNTMPQCYQYSFGKRTTVIIDCFEVFIEKPTNLLARAQTFSSYKHHNTIKVLIGITPQGTISFVSNAWGGRTSDKFLTENCGILDNLVPGDMVMADRGFTIQESVAFKRSELVIPAFTRGKNQLDPIDVEKTRGIANVRIHVERVIGLLRRKYTMLEGTLSTDYLMCNPNDQDDMPIIDCILRVCSALINLCPSVVPFD